MNFKINKKRRMIFIILLFLAVTCKILSREINVDKIYLKSNSNSLKQLISYKLENYKITNATMINSDVIYSFWIDGNLLLYIREFKNTNLNQIITYSVSARKSNKLCNLQGAIIDADISQNGKYLFIKIINYKNGKTSAELIVLNVKNNRTHHFKNMTYFKDYSPGPDEKSFVTVTEKGIIKMKIDSAGTSLLLPYKSFSNYLKTNSVILAKVSPNLKNILIISGGGGNYRGILFINKKFKYIINDISSVSEIFWINNYNIVYRKGTTGYYKTAVFNTISKKTKIISSNSFNTNIIFSKNAQIVTYLEDGMINFYNIRTGKNEKHLLEGEDVRVSNNKNYFTIIFNQTLFICKKSVLKPKRFLLKRNASKILNIYTKALSADNIHSNEYSKTYIRRKIKKYRELINGI